MSLENRKTLISSIEKPKEPQLSNIPISVSPADLKQRASLINKNMFKTTLNQNRLEKLEREALRGQCREVPEGKIQSKPKKKLDLLSLILKSEHKTNKTGTQIIKLPKLPFGRHKSYNEEPLFKDKHFFESSKEVINPEKIKELEEITRKFRLHEKKYKADKRGRLQTARPLLNDLAHYDVYDMGPGDLVCEIQNDVINSYEKDKKRFVEVLQGNYISTFRNLEKDAPEQKYLMRKTINMKYEQDLVERLMPVPEYKDTRLSLFYSTKYSSLFESPEPKSVSFNLRRSSLN
jgi:hypothetical protein